MFDESLTTSTTETAATLAMPEIAAALASPTSRFFSRL